MSVPVSDLAFSRDGQWLATATFDTRVWLWNASTWKPAFVFTNGYQITSLAFSRDSKLLAAVGNGGVTIWEVASRKSVANLPAGGTGSEYLPVGLAFSPNGQTFAYQAGQGEVALWNLAARTNVASLRGAFGATPYGVHSLEFSPDGHTLASGCWNGLVQIWDVADRREIIALTNFNGWVGKVAFSPDGKVLATASADHRIKLWDTRSWQELDTLKGHQNEVWSLAFSPDGKFLVSGGKDGTIRVWNSALPARPKTKAAFHGELESWRLSPDSTTLITIFANHTYSRWDTATLHESESNLVPLPAAYSRWGPVSPLGALMSMGDRRARIQIWDTTSRAVVRELLQAGNLPERACFSPDGKILAVPTTNQTIAIWNLTSERKPIVVPCRNAPISSMALSRNGKVLAFAYETESNTAEVWQVAEQRKVLEVSGHEPMNGVAVSLDGTLVAMAGRDATVRLGNVAARKIVHTFGGELNTYVSVAFSPDNQRLAGAGYSGIRVWDVESKQEVATLGSGEKGFSHIGFTPDGETLVAVDPHSVRTWRAPSLAEIGTREKAKAVAK